MKSVIFKFAALSATIAFRVSIAGSYEDNVERSIPPVSALFERSSKGAVTFAWGEHTTARIIETQTMFIRHTATKLQRQVAEKNARAYVAQLPPEKKLQLQKRKVRYIAVPTVRSKETSPEAREVLMIWDIPRESLAGKNVYELGTTPSIGKLATYDNLVAEYVGKPAQDF